MERGEQDSWALFYKTGLPQAYTYLKEREQRQRQNGNEKSQPSHYGRPGAGG